MENHFVVTHRAPKNFIFFLVFKRLLKTCPIAENRSKNRKRLSRPDPLSDRATEPNTREE